MKKYKNTIALAIATLAVLIFAILEYKSSEGPQVPEGVVRFYSEVEMDKVSKIVLTDRDTNEQTVLEQKDSAWVVSQPVEDKASYTDVEAYVAKLKVQDFFQLEVEGLKIDNEKFGFKDPLFDVEVVFKGKKGLDNSKQVVFSKVKTYDKKYFVKTNENGKKNVLLTSEQALKDLRKDHKFFRNKVLLPNGAEEVTKVTLDYARGSDDVELLQEDFKWQVKALKGIRLAQYKVEDFISSFQHLKMDSIFKDNFTSEDVSVLRLNRPLVTMTLHWKDKDWWMKVSPPENNVHHVMVKDSKTIYRVSAKNLEKFLVQNEDFRNKVYPFNFNMSLLDYFEIETANIKGKERYLLKNNKWTDYDENPHRKVDDARVRDFLTSLTHLQVDKFEGKKISHFANKILLASKQEVKTVFQLRWGNLFEKDGTKYYYVNTSLEPNVFVVKAQTIDDLFKDSLYTVEEAVKEAPSSESNTKESTK